MDQLTTPSSWPAAPRGGITLVQHPAWEAARNAVLDLAAEGPVTVFLTGEPGSGKTWLLRELAASFGQHGFPTMVLLRGDLPVPLGDGVAVLVDEASYMPEPARDALAGQDRGVVVLADVGPFVVAPVAGGPPPVFIHLRLLDTAEIGAFAADWLQQETRSSVALEPDAVERLAAHSGGAVRLVAQLLTAAIAVSRTSADRRLTATLIDQVAGFRLGGSMPDIEPLPAAAPGSPPVTATEPLAAVTVDRPIRGRRQMRRFAMAGAALAACVVAALITPGLRRPAPTPGPKLPPIQSAQSAAPDTTVATPPVVTATGPVQEGAEPTSASLADRVVPPPTSASEAGAGREVLPALQAATIPEPALAAPAVTPSLASPPPPMPATASIQLAAPHLVSPPVVPAPPVAAASIPSPVAVPVVASGAVASSPAVTKPATAGLVLIARPGDTLERLYTDIYHGRRPPPFATILAANPSRFKAGSIVVFPEPVGGWNRTQR